MIAIVTKAGDSAQHYPWKGGRGGYSSKRRFTKASDRKEQRWKHQLLLEAVLRGEGNRMVTNSLDSASCIARTSTATAEKLLEAGQVSITLSKADAIGAGHSLLALARTAPNQQTADIFSKLGKQLVDAAYAAAVPK